MSTPKFIVSHEDQQLGPFDEAELREKWTSGAILAVDYVYDEAKQDWIMVAERFRWAANGTLTDTVRMPVRPTSVTEEMTVELEITPEQLPPPPPASPSLHATPPVLIIPPVIATAAGVPPRAIRLTDGYGEISLDALNAGSFELSMRGEDLPTTKIRLDLLNSEPTAVLWSLPATVEVDHPLRVDLRVVDAQGRTCVRFERALTVVLAGKRHSVQTIDGTGRLEITQQVAETVSVHLEIDPALTLEMPAKQTVEWLAGPAVKLVVDGPTEPEAGIPLKVRVKALDRFGNVARSYQGVVNLEVKAG